MVVTIIILSLIIWILLGYILILRVNDGHAEGLEDPTWYLIFCFAFVGAVFLIYMLIKEGFYKALVKNTNE